MKANQGAAGVDHVTVEEFERHLETNREKLSRSRADGSYRPQAIRRVWIPKPGGKEKRPLGIPTVRDRVVQTARRAVREPIFERDCAAHRYGFRPKRGGKDALRRVDALLTAGYHGVDDADLKSYFDTIPQAALLDRVGEKVADSKGRGRWEAFLPAKVMETTEGWTPEEGTPQGAVISPWLSHIYLDPLDHRRAAAGLARVRYADDFVIWCRNEAAARQALERVQSGAATAGRQRHPTKTRIVDAAAAGGFDFLGDPFAGGTRWPRRKSLDKRKDTWRAKPRRTHGPSLSVIITNLNRTLRGGYGYFQHRHATTFTALDPWVRTRRRSLRRQRRGRHGRARGADLPRWPKAFFTACGLFSWLTAQATARQSSGR